MDSITYFRFGVRRSSMRFALLSALVTMGPCFALPLAVLACCLLPADSCIVCTKEGQAAIDSFQKNYLPGRLNSKEEHTVLFKLGELYQPVWPVNEAKGVLGNLDEKTAKEVGWSFQEALKRLTDKKVKGQQLVNELTKLLEEQRNFYFGKSLQYLKDGQCPNKCGLMLQPVLNCQNCQTSQRFCNKTINCGVRDVKVHEMEDLVLDCLLSWHPHSEGLTDYSFIRVWKKNSETLLQKGKEAVYTKSLVDKDDAGFYRCELDTMTSGLATIIEYRVTVLPPKDKNKPGNYVPNHKTTPVHVNTVHVTTVGLTTVRETTLGVTNVGDTNGGVSTIGENTAGAPNGEEATNNENPNKENPNQEKPDKENPNNENPSSETTMDETPVEVTSASTTSKQPLLFTIPMDPSLDSQAQSMLQGRLLGLQVCLLVLLVLLIALRIFLVKKNKEKPESSELGSEKGASSKTKVGSAPTDATKASSTASTQSKAAKTPPAQPKVQKTASKQPENTDSKTQKK